MNPFDVVASALRVGGVDAVPKPLLIEASAGTGKTWALAHLATRFMIEDGVEPGQLLLVTFTRDAARALRGRVREHLVEAIDVMTRAAPVADDWTAALEARWGDDAQRLADLARARHCLAGLDELQASTIHAFAAVNTLGPVGRLGDGERRWRQALAETRARWAATRPGEYALAASGVSTIEAVARALWDAGWRTEGAGAAVRVVPEGDPDPGDVTARAAAARRDIALDVVARFGELLRQARETTFADLVVALAARLEHHDAEHFVARMRSTFRVVMIDEFQDTDPLQWHVFRELFLEAPDTRLVLVGDPKQAIYRFRSASVDTFLEVREYCRARGVAVSTLTRNYRSTPAMVAALNALFRGADFHYAWAEASEEPAIAYRPAVSSREDDESSPVSGPGGAALVLRAAPYARWVARAVHEEVSDHVVRAHAAGVAYREIAVLCVSNDQCRDVHRHLARRGLPSTSSSEESIFACDAALHLRHLLAALAAPEEVGLTEALRATWFAGPGAEDPGDTRVGQTVARLVVDFEVSGVAAIGRYLRSVDVATRVARRRDGERHLTDLAHLGELMVRECRAAASPALVLSWLEDAASALDTDESATSRRLETESDAVRVLTVHKSKGLEFDVVLAPRLAGTFRKVESEGRYALRRWVDDGRTVVDAGSGVAWGASAECAERVGRTEADSAAEQRRLVYVALTRARRTAVAWVGLPIKLPFSSEFTRLLFDRHEVDARSVVTNRSLAEVRARFVDHGWLAGRDPAVTAAKTDPARVLADVFAPDPEVAALPIEEARTTEATGRASTVAPLAPLAARHGVTRARQRRRWSYSDLARDLADAEVAERPEEVAGTDEAVVSEEQRVLADETVRADVAGVFGSLAGARLGVAVHRVLERVVAVGPGADLAALLDATLEEAGEGALVLAPEDRATMRRALSEVLARPLGATLQGRALRDLDPRDAATEMRFLLSLGEVPRADRLSAAVAAVRAHDASGEARRGLFADYFASGVDLAGRLGEGFLVGSLDLTVRGLDGAYRIVDYKTDQLTGPDRPYRAGAMARHMVEHHYPLQALFYSVALHRFLRSRLAGYDPARHLGGVDYYFVRVVGDASAEADDGLLHWAVTPAAVVAASDAMSER